MLGENKVSEAVQRFNSQKEFLRKHLASPEAFETLKTTVEQMSGQ
jgi:hypothetical protein